MPKNNFSSILVLLSSILLLACQSKTDQVEKEMQAIRKQAPLKVPSPPSFDVVPSYAYASNQLKSPFVPSSLAYELRSMAGKQVSPDFARPLQPLEQYALEELYMKGTIQNRAGKNIALVGTPDQHIEQLQVGHYMGKNFGRVVSISPNLINLLEIVPDGRGGFVERPRMLVLHADPE